MADLPVRTFGHDGEAAARVAALPDSVLITFAHEVISRLARWADDVDRARHEAERPRQQPDVPELCRALISLDPQAARKMILKAHDEGASHADLCLYHISPAAHRLGVLWDLGRVSSSDMRLAGARTLTLLRDLRDLAPPFEPRRGRCALFATVPGEDHVLGITMASDLFRDDGWDVHLELGTTEERLVEMVKRARFPIVGLSAGSLERLPALAHVIVALRVVAPKVLVFVGGRLARDDDGLAARVGADGAAWQMEHCRTELERLHGLLPGLSQSR